MFGCGGDRAFLVKHSLTLAGFLAAVREGDEASVLKFVKSG